MSFFKNGRFTALCASVLLASTLLSSCRVVDVDTTADTGSSDSTTGEVVIVPDSGEVIYETEHFKVDDKMVRFFMYDIADQVVSTSSAYIELYGGTIIDYTQSMKDQYIMTDTTWYDYCAEYLDGYMDEYLILAESAINSGKSLTESEEKLITDWANNDFDESKYSSRVSKETAAECLKLKTLAMKYACSELFEHEFTIDEVNAYFAENKKLYSYIDYRYFSVNYISETDETETEAENEETDEDEYDEDGEEITLTADQAADMANALKECKSDEEFASVLLAKMELYYASLDEEEKTDAVEGTLVEGQPYSEGYDELDWMFDEQRQVGDVYYDHNEEEQVYTVMMIVKPLYSDESKTVNVRHILVMPEDDTDEADAAAKAKADAIYAKFTSGGSTVADFKVLAMLYSEDGGSCMMGGIYEGIFEGDMVEEFDDWCFDESRAVGDSAIVKTDYGYHIMYFDAFGLTGSLASARAQLLSDTYSETYENLSNSIVPTYNEDKFTAMDF